MVKGLPVTRFPHPSEIAHAYAYCANEQGKFAAFERQALEHEGAYTAQTMTQVALSALLDTDTLAACLASERSSAYHEKVKILAQELGVSAVPEFFLNNQRLSAPSSVEGWVELLGLRT